MDQNRFPRDSPLGEILVGIDPSQAEVAVDCLVRQVLHMAKSPIFQQEIQIEHVFGPNSVGIVIQFVAELVETVFVLRQISSRRRR